MKKHVLIVEDNAIALFIETKLMENLDCQVEGAPTGEEAIELTEKNKYDLILMDIGLPGIDGIETTRRIRLSEAVKQHDLTPIIAVTGNADQRQRVLCLEAGMNNVVVKPLSVEMAKSILSDLDQPGKDRMKFEP